MKINNNIQALNAYRNLYQNQFKTSKNLEKLSSGLRINRAADDAAGLAISEKMRSQIRGLKQAERNALDGISLMQTSEGAMQEVHAMLQRMRELAVQASNDTNTEYDREQIQKEIDQLKLEIDSISDKTEFNTRKLLDGNSAVLSSITSTEDNAARIASLPIVMDARLQSGTYHLEVTNKKDVIHIVQPNAGLTDRENDIKFDASLVEGNPFYPQPFGEYTINVRNYSPNDQNALVQVIGPDGLPLDERSVRVGQEDGDIYNIGGLSIDTKKIIGAGTVKVSIEQQATFSIYRGEEPLEQNLITAGKTMTTKNGIVRHGGIEFQFHNDMKDTMEDSGETVDRAISTFSITNNSLAFQIGPNTNQQVMIDIPRMDIVTLGIEEVDVTTHDGANKAIYQLDRAINNISEARSKLGATQNRMEHTINNLQITHENLTASESRIRDADMALEMTEFTRNNILNQSATAMLAQANQLPQGVLQLLQ
ncbi:flagellin [Evansella tamaricis]|uniref:Flagellin n=1 Tax=Evansella tamaricis TaxID=2069301 RepID=A0ABS6JM24_9BACI|nr:flagellin [Evansella tamaricis]MBU9714717.1 flagellin [Evansella tamaricis]